MTLYDKAQEDPETGCWVWNGWTNGRGYGRVRINKKVFLAHRVSYENMVAEIPDGLTIDHLCCNPSCINPYHLEPVPQSVNSARGNRSRAAEKTHCKSGHLLPEYTNGRRFCKPCRAEATRRHRAKKSK